VERLELVRALEKLYALNERSLVIPLMADIGDKFDRTSSSLDLMPPARVIAGPRALLTSILLVTRVPCRGIGGWRANPRT
jgi:hypothetical protein